MIAIVIILAIVVDFTYSYGNEKTYSITVTDKQVKRSANNKIDDVYMIFATTSTGETIVFKNSDMLFKGKFNSSDIQGQLKVGETYTVTTLGHRVPILSDYQNIIKVN